MSKIIIIIYEKKMEQRFLFINNFTRSIYCFASAVLYLLPILFLVSCSGLPQLQSENPQFSIIIDGDKNDWSDKSVFIQDANLSLMVSNDNEYLYIFASIHNSMEFLGRGLTIWFDNTGGKKYYFGLHYPLGIRERTNINFSNRQNEQFDSEHQRSERRKILSEQLLQMDRYEILGEEQKDTRTFYSKDNTPVQVALKEDQSYINYEARIPLHIIDDFLYAIAPNKDKPISLGFEFGDFERNRQGRERPNAPERFPSEGMEPNRRPPIDDGNPTGSQNTTRRRRGENVSDGAHRERANFSAMENFWIKVILKDGSKN